MRFFRKLRFHITSIFTILLALTASSIIAYTYLRNFQSIEELTDELIHQVSHETISKIDDLTRKAVLLTELSVDVIGYSADISFQNKVLIEYLIQNLRADPTIRSVNVGMENGSYLAVINPKVADLSKTPIAKDRPEATMFVVRTIDKTGEKPTEIWRFLGKSGTLLREEIAPSVSFDPRTAPWYLDMKKKEALIWTNSYLPRGSKSGEGEPAITVSLPLFNKEHQFQGLIGFNLAWTTLSSYVSRLNIGKKGRLFVLDEQANIVLPLKKDFDPVDQQYKESLVLKGLQIFQNMKQSSITLTANHTKYVLYFTKFPVSLDKKWSVIIIVPFNDFFGTVMETQTTSVFISIAILIVAAILSFLFSKRISSPIIQLSKDVDRIKHFDFEEGIPIRSHIAEIVLLNSAIRSMRSALHSFAKYMPKEIVKDLICRGEEISIGGKRETLTVMFSDIQDFTSTTESTPIDKLVSSLALYFDAISRIILEAEGTIDKYIGDSVMAFWGAPTAVPDPVNRACVATLRSHFLCNLHSQEKGLPPWKTKFGVHTGDAIVGNFGTDERMNYTAIGDTVNTASRITVLNKQYGTSILISDVVYQQMGKNFITRPIDLIAVRGKKNKITVYELVGATEGDLQPSPEQIKLCRAFQKAYDLFQGRKIPEAKALFAQIASEFPNDVPTQLYLTRIG